MDSIQWTAKEIEKRGIDKYFLLASNSDSVRLIILAANRELIEPSFFDWQGIPVLGFAESQLSAIPDQISILAARAALIAS